MTSICRWINVNYQRISTNTPLLAIFALTFLIMLYVINMQLTDRANLVSIFFFFSLHFSVTKKRETVYIFVEIFHMEQDYVKLKFKFSDIWYITCCVGFPNEICNNFSFMFLRVFFFYYAWIYWNNKELICFSRHDKSLKIRYEFIYCNTKNATFLLS